MKIADGQGGYRVRFDWGPVGADAVAPGAAFVAVVDVLSFTTTLTVAVEQGMSVLPYRWRDDSAVGFARRHGAMLAVLRSQAGPGQITLSPESILRADLKSGGIDRLVLPSPNGSAISVRLADAGATVVGVCLRNAAAAAEDLWGDGAFIDGLSGHDGPAGCSPEAATAVAAYRGVAAGLAAALGESVSGRELRSQGFAGDVEVAAELGASTVVPVLREGWFRNGRS